MTPQTGSFSHSHTQGSLSHSGYAVGGLLLGSLVDAGGGAYIGGSATFIDCSLYDNEASTFNYNGGGAYIAYSGSANFINCNLHNNEVSGYGEGSGAYIANGGSADFTGCNLYDNKATFGAALFIDDDASASLSCCTVEGGVQGTFIDDPCP